MSGRGSMIEVLDLVSAAKAGNLSRRAMFQRAAAVGLSAASFNALLATLGGPTPAAAALRHQATELAAEQVIRLPEGEPVRFDPGVTPGGKGLEILQNLFEGLVGVDQRTGVVELLQAEAMEANAEATQFTFTLRDGLTWSDGVPITAHDYEYSWKRVLLPETASEYTTAMYPIAGAQAAVEGTGAIDEVGVRAVDDRTLLVNLVGPTPYFPLLAATWTFYPVPRHVIEEYGDAWVEAGNMVSNGPYILTGWEHDQSMTLERNQRYSGETPTIARADYTLFADPTEQALVAFEADELDQAQVGPADLERAQADPALSSLLQVFPRSGTRFVICDTTTPPTDNLLVRQALAISIDRETLAGKILKGVFAATEVMLPPDIPGHNPDLGIGEDVARAQALLAEAGYPDGAGFPPLTLVYIATDSTEKICCEYLQSAWKQHLGIDIRLEALEDAAWENWFTSLDTTPFNLYISLWGSDWGDPANWHNQLFESSADFYHAHWKNDEFDQLVNDARGLPDPVRRLELYEQAEAILNQDAAFIPLHNLNRIFVIKPYANGVYHYPILGLTWLRYISILKHE